jgi:hypothetical protein
MRLIVADAYGSGYLDNSEHGQRALSTDEWTEVDVRDVVIAGDEAAVVRYRDDGREVTVGAGETYRIESENEDVIDVRGAADAAAEIAAAIEGIGTDEERIYRALEQIPYDRNREPWIEQLRALFEQQTGKTLDAALAGDLSGDELERALDYLR